MPRRPSGIPDTSMQHQFALRVEEETARRGWSDAALAQRVSNHRADCVFECHHYPMSATTMWKIRNSNPPRRVDLDEATAIAVGAFGYPNVADFLVDSPLSTLRWRVDQQTQTILVTTAGLTDAERDLRHLEAGLASPDQRERLRSMRGTKGLTELAKGFTLLSTLAEEDTAKRLAAVQALLKGIGQQLAELNS